MSKSYWDKKIKKYSEEDWANMPSIFAKTVLEYLSGSGELLELAAGYGQDGRFFAEQGYKVTQTDFSGTSLDFLTANAKNSENLGKKIVVIKQDLTESLNFPNESFDIVYCHLGIHYFPWAGTERLVQEMSRVLKPNGVIAVLTNSTEDPDIAKGKELEKNYYSYEDLNKRYFDIEDMGRLMKDFETVLLDNQGTTYKDAKIGVNNLIRFVGKKC